MNSVHSDVASMKSSFGSFTDFGFFSLIDSILKLLISPGFGKSNLSHCFTLLVFIATINTLGCVEVRQIGEGSMCKYMAHNLAFSKIFL